MKYLHICVGAAFAGALLTACGGNHSTAPFSGLMPPGGAPFQGAASDVEVLHAFPSARGDGLLPTRALVDVKGTLYGTTDFGGSSSCLHIGAPISGCGTIFKIDTSGASYRVLHAFPKNGLGGAVPGGRLVYSGGALYGATLYGGGAGCVPYGCGTVFAIGPSGTPFRILHKFRGGPEGSSIGGIVAAAAALYGVAYFGGNAGCNCGVIFSLSPSGTETILHAFGGRSDGRNPLLAPIDLNGSLYGATQSGGGTACNYYSGYSGCGTLYKMSASSKNYAVLYRFKGGTDGEFPNNVIALNGTLYGTTSRGGGAGCGGVGCGTVFKIRTDGTGYAVLYRFNGGMDGAVPNDIVAQIGKTLYSGTSQGGGFGCQKSGCGTVFRIDTSGKGYAVIYRFRQRKNGAAKDGARPSAGPTEANGVLYGVTSSGGGVAAPGCPQFDGCGTAFALRP